MGNRIRILLVDDDETVRIFLKKLLESSEREVITAEDGVVAMAMLEDENQGKFDIIISDIDMPNMDGLELMRQLSARGIGTPVIISSGSVMDDLGGEEEILRRGAAAVVSKPVNFNRLLHAIECIIFISNGGKNVYDLAA